MAEEWGDRTQHDYCSSYTVGSISFRTDFFKITEVEASHKAASVCQFLTPKMLENFITPPPLAPSSDLSPPDYFLLLKLKMKLKRLQFEDVAEIQEAVTDELKKVKNEFSAAFQKVYDRAKAYIYMCVFMQGTNLLNYCVIWVFYLTCYFV